MQNFSKIGQLLFLINFVCPNFLLLIITQIKFNMKQHSVVNAELLAILVTRATESVKKLYHFRLINFLTRILRVEISEKTRRQNEQL